MSAEKRLRQRQNKLIGEALELEIRQQVRAEAEALGYRPDGDPAEQQAYALLIAAMAKHTMGVAEADEYLDRLFASQGPQAPAEPIELDE